MTRLRVLHLVDDTTAGGVMRVLDHILTAPALAQQADHSLRCIKRGSLLTARLDADVIVSHLAISWRALAMLVALRLMHPRTPLIHVEHSYTDHFTRHNVTRKRRFATLLRTAYALFNHVVAVSHAQGAWLVETGAVKPAALLVIQSCVDLSAFRALAAPVGPVRVIGAIGRLDDQKGFDILVRAFRRTTNPGIALHIYGEGAQEGRLRALAEDDPRILFKGFAPDPVAAMAAVDAVAMPSRWEAYGLVAIEALAAQRSLLVNGIDGLSDHVPNGARQVAGQDVQSWQEALETLTDVNAPASRTLAENSASPERAFETAWVALLNRARLG
ncbi:Glycosyltransferase involved in cell wall bisynthesis [Pseudosulfitobacter pseudonitzschiae]|uniref:Glycosyl transferase n=1 Tax=Pseudosulfitobacter pseudonitzschiae TaxID=1402135 RepID=A0A073J2J0_9RHOB|nr:glycosyltransferase [Pseudosulfitobacter pseudonitzschiae]KEJ96015.1 glycosyl transferase [Pseudosulfitobacter pseudonitzschiae]QKS09827.1 glycosyltransferase [Pseudosulfitobacter pseudonitzschiae]SHE94232.1 Glycosyltransferase involved in cell wall bisynthesis [Pseudosulfitobacter pseudonitzschiae]